MEIVKREGKTLMVVMMWSVITIFLVAAEC